MFQSMLQVMRKYMKWTMNIWYLQKPCHQTHFPLSSALWWNCKAYKLLSIKDKMKELMPSLPPWKHMELLQRDKNIFCTHQGIVGIFINDNSYQYASGTFRSTLHLSFCCWVCSNPTSWVLLLPPSANKEMDLSEPERGPCVPAADGIASP